MEQKHGKLRIAGAGRRGANVRSGPHGPRRGAGCRSRGGVPRAGEERSLDGGLVSECRP
jgi:hypothetical protein